MASKAEKRAPALTRGRIEALLAVADEFIAGHGAEGAEDAGVCDEGEGAKFIANLEAAMKALQRRLRG